jgi:hypothetical protein
MEFPLKWEIHNMIMYIKMSTPIMTCLEKYFPIRLFNEVMAISLFYGISIKMGDSQQHYDVHNNVHSNYNAHGLINKSQIRRKCIQLYSKVK